MNILQICKKSPFPEHDGEAIAIASFIKAWVRNQHQVFCIVLETEKHPFHLNDIPEEFKTSVTWLPYKINTSINFTSAVKNLFSTQSIILDRFQPDHLIEKISRDIYNLSQNINLIQAEGIYVHRIAKHLKESVCREAKYIYRSHNIEFKLWNQRIDKMLPGLKKRFLQYQLDKLKVEELGRLNDADFHIDISKDDLIYLKKRGLKIDGRSLPTGFDFQSFIQLVPNYENNRIQYLGSLNWEPNIEGLKWLAQEVWTEDFRTEVQRIRVAGKSAPDNILEELGEGFEYIGEVDSAEEFMSQSGIFVIPLISGSGVKIKLLQALSLGLPILTTSKGAEGIDIIHNKHALIVDHPSEWKKGILSLLGSKKLREELGNNAKAFAQEEIDLNNIYRKWMEFVK